MDLNKKFKLEEIDEKDDFKFDNNNFIFKPKK